MLIWNILETEADTEINGTFGISARILPQLKLEASDNALLNLLSLKQEKKYYGYECDHRKKLAD